MPYKAPTSWQVILGERIAEVTVVSQSNGYSLTVDGKPYDVITNWNRTQPLFKATINGKEICVQIDRRGIGYKIFSKGCEFDVKVLTQRTVELNRHMIEKAPPDLSRFLLSPMPGLLVTLRVEVGQEVKAGEELAVVEAMKMENSLKAIANGVVKEVRAAVGDSLKVDQPIIEFE